MQNYIGKTCPYCQCPIKIEVTVQVCPICKIPHHYECWIENTGCTTFACTGKARNILNKNSRNINYISIDNQPNDFLLSEVRHAGFWLRAVAIILDYVLIIIVLLFLELTLPSLADNSIFSFTAMWLYYAFFESSSLQATPGKLALGLSVTDINGRRLGFGRATGRHFGKILSGIFIGFGYFMAGFTKEKQGLHDILAGCYVLKK